VALPGLASAMISTPGYRTSGRRQPWECQPSRFSGLTAARTGKGLFLDFDARAPLRALATRWGGRIAYATSEAKDRLGLSAVLVRPDGVVAWVSEGAPNVEEASQAAARWFGEPDEERDTT
jgi:aromatic ring hydroxylase-like protein